MIYSLRGGKDNRIDEIAALSADEINACLDVVFDPGAGKTWYASGDTGDGIAPLEHFKSLSFTTADFTSATRALKLSLEKSVRGLEPDIPGAAAKIEPLFQSLGKSHPATLVHGDLTLQNLVRTEDTRVALIDYRTVGIGPRLIDFATLEIAAWLLAQAPAVARSQRFLDARLALSSAFDDARDVSAIPEWLRDSWGLAQRCRKLAKRNHPQMSVQEYAGLLWLSAVRVSTFKSRATTAEHRRTHQVLPAAIAIAAQEMFDA